MSFKEYLFARLSNKEESKDVLVRICVPCKLFLAKKCLLRLLVKQEARKGIGISRVSERRTSNEFTFVRRPRPRSTAATVSLDSRKKRSAQPPFKGEFVLVLFDSKPRQTAPRSRREPVKNKNTRALYSFSK